MGYFRKNVRKLWLLISIVLIVGACAEEITEGYQSLMQTEFQASLYEWEEYEVSDTRSVNDSTKQTISIPVYADDGEEFELTITSEKDTVRRDSVVNETATRGTVLTYDNIKGKTFKCYAYVNGDGEADKLLIDGINLTINSSSGAWLPTSGTQYEWPSPTQVITFYGIIPTTTTFSSRDKTVTFTQTTTASSQTDLLIAASDPLNQAKDANTKDADGNEVAKAIPIKFRHALTAVKFKANSNLPGMTLNSVQLTGFYASGIYTLPIGDTNGSWITTGSTTTFTASPNVTAITGSTTSLLNDGANTFLMIPQSMAKTKKLVLNVTAGGSTRTLTANFNGLPAWMPGTLVTYTLGKKADTGWYLYTNRYLPNGEQYVYLGESTTTDTYQVTSYSLTTTSASSVTKTAQPWKLVAYSTNGSSWTNWTSGTFNNSNGNAITVTASSGNGSSTGGTESFSYQRVLPPLTYSGDRITIGNSIKGTSFSNTTAATAVDLSTYDVLNKATISKTTANCYIVNGVGYFKFPTVYGNGYKDGSINYQAFKTTNASSGTNMFKNHAGNWISSPDITIPSGATAKVVWMDYELTGCIANVSYASNYITFQIKSSTNLTGSALVPPGNIVIGLFNGNDLIWQWHIYLYNSNQGVRDLGKTFVGHVTNRAGGVIYFRLQQTNNTNSITQTRSTWYGQTTSYANRVRSLNYTWGFPRPLPATEQTNGTVENYTNNGTMKKASYVNTPASYSTETYNNASNNATYYQKRWNGTVKTIFDPSPRGYRVPASSEFGVKFAIGEDAPFVSGWALSDGGILAIPYGQTIGYYLSSNVGSNTLYYVNSSKTLNKTTGTVTSSGMVHPVAE